MNRDVWVDRREGFTMVELMIVIMIISILASIAVPIAISARNEARRLQAQNDVNNIANAIEGFYRQYGRFPVDANQQGGGSDLEVDTSGGAVIAALMGQNTAINPSGRVFLEVDMDDVTQGYLDPWDRGYIVRMDTNFNGYVAKWPNPVTADGANTSRVRAVAMAVSLGADGQRDTDLDIVSSHAMETRR